MVDEETAYDEWWGARTAMRFGSANRLPRSGTQWDALRDMQPHTNVSTTLVEAVSIQYSDPRAARPILRFERENSHWLDGRAKVAQGGEFGV